MAMKYNNQNVSAITYNGQQVNELLQDGVYLWTRPFAYAAGSAVGLASLVCTRHLTNEPSASTGTVDSGSTVYYGDRLYWTATASTGYRIVSISYDSPSNTYRVLGDVTGVSAAGLSIARISGTITQGTLPTGVSSITCYRKAWDGSDFSVYTGSTIYYGDQFYWVASPSTGYTNPSVTYGSSSNPYTWTGSQGGSITSVGASGLAAGELKQYAVSFGTTSGKSLYGSWGSSSLQARHFDKIVVSGTTVTCYVGDSSTVRWSNTVTKTPDDAQYSYTTPTITGSSIASLTGPTSYTAENTRSVNTYNIIFKYRSAYSTWSESTVVYKYGDTPTVSTPVSGTVPSPSTVTSDNSRFVPTSWDDLSQVTGARTITMGYTTQCYATISGSYCSANRSTGWYDSGTVITWTAESNYSFGGSSVGDTTTATITAGGTYSKTPGYVKCTIGGIRCSANKLSGSILAVGTTITWTASSNCAFNSAGTTTTATQNVALGTLPYSESADYIYVTIGGTNCSANLSTGWHAYGTTCTWSASSNYAFDASGTTTSTASLTSPGSTYEKSPGYGLYVVDPAGGCSADVSSGWYAVTSSKTTTFTADDGCSFGGSSTQDTTTVSAPVPGFVSATPGYYQITVLSTNCSANVSSGIVGRGTTVTWTANTDYAFDSSGTTTATSTIYGPGLYGKSAGHGKCTITLANCTPNKSTGWYPITSSLTIQAVAWNGWSFGGSSVGDTTTVSVAVPGSIFISPGYCNITVSGTNCSANKSSGIIANGTQIIWQANTNYAFNSSGGATSTATVSGPGTYSKSPGYGYYTVSTTNCTANVSSGWYGVTSRKTTLFTANNGWSFNGSSTQDTTTASAAVPGSVSASPSYCNVAVSSTRCSANVSSGIMANGTTITWTANTNYAFNSSGTTTSTATVSGPGTYSKSADYGYYSVSTTNCTANVSSGWYEVTSSKTTTFTASDGWSFNGSSVKDTTTSSAAVPGSVSASPGYCNVTISGTNCSANVSSGIRANGATITWTANTSYAFNSSGTSTSTATINGPGTYSKTAGYGRYTVSATHCSANVSTGWYAVTSSKTTTFTADDGWSFGGSSVKDTTTKSAAVPGSVSAMPAYCNVTISSTRCSANKSSGIIANGTQIRWTANTNYAFNSSGTTQSMIMVNGPGTYSKSADYGYYTVSASNCSADVSSGWYGITSSKTTTFTANTNWSFGGSSVGDTTTKSAAVPGSVSASPGYCKITGLSYSGCTPNVSLGDIVANGSTITWTAGITTTFQPYAFDNTGTQTATTTVNGPGTYSKTADYGKYTVSTTNCTADVATGWYGVTASKTTTFTANNDWSFGGSSVKDTTTKSAAVPGRVVASPGYCKITVNATWSSANVSSGIVANGTVITWTSVSSKYAFNSSGARTTTMTVAGPQTYAQSANYVYVTVSGTNCSANVSSGWYTLGSTLNITWTASSGYAFENSGLTTSTLSGRTVTGPTTLSRSAVTGTYGYNFGNTTVYLGQLATWTNCGWASFSSDAMDISNGTPLDVNGNQLNLENWNFTKVTPSVSGNYTLYLIKGADLQQVVYFLKNNSTGNFVQCMMHCYDRDYDSRAWNAYGGTFYSDLVNLNTGNVITRDMFITDYAQDAYTPDYSDLTGIVFAATAVE